MTKISFVHEETTERKGGKMKILVVVDMQNDFITGSLGTKEAEAIVPKVEKKIRSFDGEIIYTRDTHEQNYLRTQEGKNLPVVHCIRQTEGWNLHPAIEALRGTALTIDKPTFGSSELGLFLAEKNDAQKMNDGKGLESVTCIGLCTDICVISNVLLAKAFLPEVPIFVEEACCAGVTPESHANAIKAMKACQVQVI